MGYLICKKKAAGMLALFFIISVILYPMVADAADRQDDSRFRIWITVGDQDFSAELYDNETTRAWVGQMPMTLEMSELNGNEKYHYFSESLPTNPERPDAIHTGDLMLYGQSCLVLFYKDFVTSYSYTPLGYMEDATGLAKALGNGNVTVAFRLDDGKLPDGKEELWKLYDEEKVTLNQGYTAQSWMAFEDARKKAKNTLEDQNATAENVQDAIIGLENAKKGLVTLESVLEKEILNYSKVDSDGDNYTEESWNAYQNALKEAEGLKQAGGYTEAIMDQTIAALRTAYENLELQTSEKQPEQKTVKVRAIKLTGNVIKLAKGKRMKLKAVVSPANASDKRLKWTSSDKKVAAVTTGGIVTGKKKGTATITATATDGSGIKCRYKITVMPHAVKRIILKSKTKSIVVGKKVKVTATVSVTGKKANKKLVWSTSNKKYATVNANGKVTAKKAGKGKKVLITARATDGSGKKASIILRIKSSGGQGADSVMNIQVGKKVFKAKLADNSSAKALAKKLAKSPIIISMQDYGGFEKVGDFGFNLVTNDKQITTEPGDLVLYEGDQLVIFYGKNSWSYTRLGKIQNVTAKELKAALGNGDVTVTLSLL